MMALAHVAGLPISVNDEVESLVYDDEIECECTRQVPLLDIIPSLLNKALRYPEKVYSMHCRMLKRDDCESWPQEFEHDIFFIPPGLLGIEYIKTHIFHFPKQKATVACIVQVLRGKLTIIMQCNHPREDIYDVYTRVKEAYLVEVDQGEKAVIPAGFYYTFINTQDVPVVFARVVRQEHVLNYLELRRENGLAYYLISKNATQQVVTNPRYRDLPDVKKIRLGELNGMSAYQPTAALPLYEEVKAYTRVVAQYLSS